MTTHEGLPPIDVGRWVRCEREALEGGAEPRQGAVGVLVARAVEMLLQGCDLAHIRLEMAAYDDTPVQYDRTTPRGADAERQAELMHRAIEAALSAHPLTLGRWAGDADGLLYDSQGRAHRCIVVTGRRVGSAWLRLGRELAETEGGDIERGVLVHCPRVRLDYECEATVEVREVAALRAEWRARAARIWDVLHGLHPPLATPGEHCARCTVRECAVRVG